MNFQDFAARLEGLANGANASARRALDVSQNNTKTLSELVGEFNKLNGLVDGLKVRGSGGGAQLGRPDMLTIEEIPGRRIPFDITIQIGIPSNHRGVLPGNHTLSMDGPFVAVARSATFISTHTFQVTTNDNRTSRIISRSFGRQRPISSTLDLMDAVTGWVDGTTETMTGDCDQVTPAAALISRPTSRSPFRTMGFDGYIQVKSSVYPRQNQKVPSSLWAPGFNQMFQLPVLDYFEKGESIEFEVEPMHMNNPTGGNIAGLLGSMPFLAGQYDGHEGISYADWDCDSGNPDTIQRDASGILVLCLHGFKILQPPGVRMR